MLDRLTDSSDAALSLTILTETSWPDWHAGQTEATQLWLRATAVSGKVGTLTTVPDSDGQPAWVAVIDPADPWSGAAVAGRLPAGTYRLSEGADSELPTPTAFAWSWALAGYRFARYRANSESGRPVLIWPTGADRDRAQQIVSAITLGRDLINTPAGDLGPAELAEVVRDLATTHGGSFRQIVGEDLLAENYPLIHAVGRASSKPPRLIDLNWGDPSHPRVTLVGKGVCFDSGGLDLKPSSNMKLMKKDMGGAATATALAALIMAAGLKIRLRLLVPAVENMVAGNAYHPLDILPSRAGKTVEVGNTDAEGRLILADALTEATSEQPTLLIDLATLTGAARVALGPDLPALFTHDEALALRTQQLGEALQDPLWRLPLWPGYRRLLETRHADLSSTGDSPFAGAITAALFLAAFVPEGQRWMHLDLYAWNNRARPGRPEGGEIQTLRTLFAVIEEMQAA